MTRAGSINPPLTLGLVAVVGLDLRMALGEAEDTDLDLDMSRKQESLALGLVARAGVINVDLIMAPGIASAKSTNLHLMTAHA